MSVYWCPELHLNNPKVSDGRRKLKPVVQWTPLHNHKSYDWITRVVGGFTWSGKQHDVILYQTTVFMANWTNVLWMCACWSDLFSFYISTWKNKLREAVTWWLHAPANKSSYITTCVDNLINGLKHVKFTISAWVHVNTSDAEVWNIHESNLILWFINEIQNLVWYIFCLLMMTSELLSSESLAYYHQHSKTPVEISEAPHFDLLATFSKHQQLLHY